jgi:hypothetical protein
MRANGSGTILAGVTARPFSFTVILNSNESSSDSISHHPARSSSRSTHSVFACYRSPSSAGVWGNRPRRTQSQPVGEDWLSFRFPCAAIAMHSTHLLTRHQVQQRRDIARRADDWPLDAVLARVVEPFRCGFSLGKEVLRKGPIAELQPPVSWSARSHQPVLVGGGGAGRATPGRSCTLLLTLGRRRRIGRCALRS